MSELDEVREAKAEQERASARMWHAAGRAARAGFSWREIADAMGPQDLPHHQPEVGIRDRDGANSEIHRSSA